MKDCKIDFNEYAYLLVPTIKANQFSYIFFSNLGYLYLNTVLVILFKFFLDPSNTQGRKEKS